MKYQLNQWLTFIFFLALFSCNGAGSGKKDNVMHTDQFVKDIPLNLKGTYIYTYELTSKYIEKVKLEKIENGFDSMFIRLWYVYSSGPWQIIELKNYGGKWNGEFILLEPLFNESDSTYSINKSSVIKKPKSDWDKFTRKLFYKRITALPSDHLIPNYHGANDTDLVIVEVATRNYYRLYHYSSIDFNLKKKEVKDLVNIIKLIEEEFGVKSFHKWF